VRRQLQLADARLAEHPSIANAPATPLTTTRQSYPTRTPVLGADDRFRSSHFDSSRQRGRGR
jgi:hypothetical protein